MANEKIRESVRVNKVRFWEIAERMGMQDSALSRKMRRELPEAEQAKILNIVKEIAEERGAC